MHWFMWWPTGWMGLFWLAVIAVALAVAFRGPCGPRHPWREVETPEQILKKRYARGEITKEEYERVLADLRR